MVLEIKPPNVFDKEKLFLDIQLGFWRIFKNKKNEADKDALT